MGCNLLSETKVPYAQATYCALLRQPASQPASQPGNTPTRTGCKRAVIPSSQKLISFVHFENGLLLLQRIQPPGLPLRESPQPPSFGPYFCSPWQVKEERDPKQVVPCSSCNVWAPKDRCETQSRTRGFGVPTANCHSCKPGTGASQLIQSTLIQYGLNLNLLPVSLGRVPANEGMACLNTALSPIGIGIPADSQRFPLAKNATPQ